jgi:nucleotide-binding universal stress UspA family protein
MALKIVSGRENRTMFKKILFCTDFSENAHHAFTYALNLAKTYKGELLILHITPEPVEIYRPTEQLEEVVRKHHKKVVDEEVASHYVKEMKGFKDYRLLLKEGSVYSEIIKTAGDEGANVIVMGTQGRTGLDEMLMGSTAERVVRKSPVPVLTVRLPGK